MTVSSAASDFKSKLRQGRLFTHGNELLSSTIGIYRIGHVSLKPCSLEEEVVAGLRWRG